MKNQTEGQRLFLYGHGKGKNMGLNNCYDPRKYVDKILSGNLPHWEQPGVMQFITFRLAHSLPQSKILALKEERDEWLRQHPQPWSFKDQLEYEELFNKNEEWLDKGYGECLLTIPEIQHLVEDSLRYHDGIRYDLFDFIIMPNHVHILIIPAIGYECTGIVKSIKGFSGLKINKLLKRKGQVWERESWDRMIRSPADYAAKAEYIKHNGDCLVS